MKPADLPDLWERTPDLRERTIEELAKTDFNAILEEAPDLSATWGITVPSMNNPIFLKALRE